MNVDPTSADIALVYVGEDGRGAAGAPPRDLTEADVARLVYKRELAAVTADIGRPSVPDDPESEPIAKPDPRKPRQAAVDELVDALKASGRYAGPNTKAAKAKGDDAPPESPAREPLPEPNPPNPNDQPDGAGDDTPGDPADTPEG